jgi:hypothetical protein
MNGRMYDPVIGRFLSPDPIIQDISQSQSLNPFSYVWNNPLKHTDPTGYAANGATAPLGSTVSMADIESGVVTASTGYVTPIGGGLGVVSLPGITVTGKRESGLWDSVKTLGRGVMKVGRIVGGLALGMIPGVGEAMDLKVLFGRESSTTDRLLAGGSLLLNLVTGGTAPNAGGAIMAARAGGRHGGTAHRATVASRAGELERQGHTVTAGGGRLPERSVITPEGKRRFPDISTRGPGGNPYHENVGRSISSGGPIARERRALDDIGRATGTRPGYTPYDR